MFTSDLPTCTEEWEALHADHPAVHMAVAEHLRDTLRSLNLSSLAGTNLHAGSTYEAVARALRIALTALMDDSTEQGERLYEALIDNGESVAYTVPLVKAEIAYEQAKAAADSREDRLWAATRHVEQLLTAHFRSWTHNGADVPAPWFALPYGDSGTYDPDTRETTSVEITWKPCAPARWARLAVHGGADEDGSVYEPITFPDDVHIRLVDDTTLAIRLSAPATTSEDAAEEILHDEH